MARRERQRSGCGLLLGVAVMLLVALPATAQPRAGPPGVIISGPRTAQEAAMQKSVEEQGKGRLSRIRVRDPADAAALPASRRPHSTIEARHARH